MRTSCWIGACLGLLAATLDARAQSAVASWGTTSIVAAQTQAWSGPNQEKNYPTNALPVNTPVVVELDKDGRPKIIQDINPRHPGWLEIKPPPGSCSWIHQNFIGKLAQANTWVVKADGPVGIYVASQVIDVEPKVERVQLSKNTQVVIVGAPRPDTQGGYYVPILSPETEPRYIRADAINKNTVQRLVPVAPRSGSVAQVSNTVPAAGSTFADLFARADAAQQLGRIPEARALYQQARGATNLPDQQRLCDQRLAALAQQGTGGWSVTAGGPNRPVNGTNALYTANKPQVRELVPGQRQWTEWGVLEPTTIPPVDGQKVFRLKVNGQAYAYATAQSGYTLDNYVGQYLTLYGLATTSPDPSMGVMRVSVQHVSLGKR